jgi:hypothetical protein
MFGPGPSLRLVLGGASLIPSLSLEVLHSKGAQEQDRCSWPGLAEQCVDPVPVRSDASELLPDGVFGVSESEHVRGVVDDRPALSGNHALRLLAYAEDRCVLGEDPHAASRDVRDPPLVAFWGRYISGCTSCWKWAVTPWLCVKRLIVSVTARPTEFSM